MATWATTSSGRCLQGESGSGRASEIRPGRGQRSPERTEGLPSVAHEEVRYLHGREVTSAIELRPVHDVVAPLGVSTDGIGLREHRHSSRCRGGLLTPGDGMHVLVVQAGRGCSRTGEPVEHDVGEHLVAVDGVFGDVRGVGPLLEPLHDPGELTDRRVGEPVGKRLRAGGLDLEIAVPWACGALAEALESRLSPSVRVASSSGSTGPNGKNPIVGAFTWTRRLISSAPALATRAVVHPTSRVGPESP